jgi:hypothetical protein
VTDKGFSVGVKIAAKARATINGVLTCEGCGQPVREPIRIDHKIARGLRGANNLENAQVLGKCCWVEKDAADNMSVKRAGRIEVRHQGIVDRPKSRIQSRGFEVVVKKSRCGPTFKTIPRRPLST